MSQYTMGASEQQAYANGHQDALKEAQEITPEMVRAGVAAAIVNGHCMVGEGVREIYLAMLEAQRTRRG